MQHIVAELRVLVISSTMIGVSRVCAHFTQALTCAPQSSPWSSRFPGRAGNQLVL